MKTTALFFTVVFIFLAAAAEAKVWKIDYPSSKLSFTGMQAGQPFTGTFGAYLAKIDFDPALPQQAKIDVSIDMASFKTGDAQRDQALPGKDWFDIGSYPQASFHVKEVSRIDETHYQAKAQLTIKDQMHEVVVPFTLTRDRDGMRAKGEVTIDRTQFNVGMGSWTSEEWVDHRVKISFDVMAY